VAAEGPLCGSVAVISVFSVIGADPMVCLWDVGTGEVLAEIALPNILFSMNFSFNGSQMVTACKDKKIRVHDARTLQVLKVSL